MGKYKLPSVQEFLKKKRVYKGVHDPVWAYIEREMRENMEKKPYNTKVGNWLKFLKDLRYHYFCEAKYKYTRLFRECGPTWYYELSKEQRDILDQLKSYIKEDLLEDIPKRTKKALWDLGITLRFSVDILLASMAESYGDPGLFIWILFTKINLVPPSKPLERYDANNMLLMSALVSIDLDECIEELNKLTTHAEPPKPKEPKKKSYYFEPNVKYGEYLQKLRVPCYSNHPLVPQKAKKPLPLANKIKLKSPESYERLYNKTDFLEIRKLRNMKAANLMRKCKYKFWEAPCSLRNTDPKLAAYVSKMRMLKLKAKKKGLKQKPPFDNFQFHIASVSYVGGLPRYVLASLVTLPTGFILINGGLVLHGNEYITRFQGMWDMSKPIINKCDKTCNCVAKWEAAVTNYLNAEKCGCKHYYDYNDDRSSTLFSKFFYPSTKHVPFMFDHAKIYQMDSMVEHVNDTFKEAMKSESSQSRSSQATVELSALKEKELLKLFLSDLSTTALLIPHLPQANLLNNLQEWCRKRVKGPITPGKHKQLLLKSQRRWLDLKHIDFRARAYEIPFTFKQLHHINWSHRYMIQKLFLALLSSFARRTRKYQMEQSRLWWSTMEYDTYPSKPFLDVFFTYMPCRFKDTLVINPYHAEIPAKTAKTCPLKLTLNN